jgi:hypothetical protein
VSQGKGAIAHALACVSWVTQARAAKTIGLQRARLVASANRELPARLGQERMLDLADWMEEAAAHLVAGAHQLRRAARYCAPTGPTGRKRRATPTERADPKGDSDE